MKVLYSLVSGAVLFSAALSADSTNQTFTNLDADSDGYISINEATGQTELLKQWTEVDKDVDGQLGVIEFSAFETQEQPAEMFTPPVNADEPDLGAAPF